MKNRGATAVDVSLAAIENDRWNAFVSIDHDGARRSAAAAEGRGLLAGLPVAVKDNIDVAGLVTTHGSALFRDEPPATADAEAVHRLRGAGAVVVGKTHLTELACGTTGINPHLGDAVNPLAPDRHTGGSSSGSAVAVAAGYVPVALGSDTGGSIRIPAAACGVVGLKPTFGRTSTRGMGVCARNLDHLGPIAASVPLAARTLAAIQNDGWPDPVPGLRPVSRTTRPLRVGVLTGPFVDDCDPDVVRAFTDAVDLVRRLGSGRRLESDDRPAVAVEDVTEIDPADVGIDPGAATEWANLLSRDLAVTYGAAARAAPAGSIGPELRAWLDRYEAVTPADYADALAERRRLIAAMERVQQTVDVLLCPTMRAAPCLRSEAESQPRDRRAGNLDLFNLTGQPSLTVPIGSADCGLPLGLCINGRPGEDGLVLALGAVVEIAAR